MNDVELEKRVAALETAVSELKQLVLHTHQSKLANWPTGLPLTSRQRKAMNALCGLGYLSIDDNQQVHWHGQAKTLAFVCGVLWSGDKVRSGFWVKGNIKFPATKLEKYFHVTSLREKRNILLGNRLSDEMSVVYEKI